MIVGSIEVAGFGCFDAPVRVELDAARVNVVAGANGTGKSTLLAALTAAFTVSYKSAAAEIKAWQPWGRAVAPWVRVEFESGGERWRLEKRYLLKGRTALLERWSAGRWVRVAEDEMAELQVPVFLGGASGAGESARVRQTLLASVLWSRQNGMALEGVDEPVREMAAAALRSQARDVLAARVEREAARLYEASWTPQGREKKASEAVRVREALGAARGEAARYKAELEELDLARRSVSELEEEEAGLAMMAGSQGSVVEELEAQRAAALRLKAVSDEVRLLEFKTARVRALREKLASVVELESELGRYEAELAATAAPSMGEVRRLEGLEQKARELRIRLEGALLHVELTPERAGSAVVVAGEAVGPVEMAAGEAVRVSGSPEVVVEVAGFGRLRAWGAKTAASEIRGELARVVAELGGVDVAELRARRERADVLGPEVARRRAAAVEAREARIELEKLGAVDEAAARERMAALALEAMGLQAQVRTAEVEGELVRARAERDGAARRAREVRELLVAQRAAAEEKMRRAPYESWAEASARVTELEERAGAAQLEADAAKVLAETLGAVRREVEGRIVPGVEEAANRIVEEIGAGRPGGIGLAPTLAPAVARVSGGEVGLEQLSGGESEQAHFAVRLALADLFTADERRLVVFDDAWMATDAARFGRILEMLERRRARMQVVLLTCHPERYGALGDARVVEMEAVRRQRWN